jgi:hypothetical protein
LPFGFGESSFVFFEVFEVLFCTDRGVYLFYSIDSAGFVCYRLLMALTFYALLFLRSYLPSQRLLKPSVTWNAYALPLLSHLWIDFLLFRLVIEDKVD